MRVEVTLLEDPTEKDKAYWAAKVKHKVDREAPEQVLLEIVSASFIPGMGAEYKAYYSNVFTRVWKELEKIESSESIIRKMWLMETENNIQE